MKTDMFDKMLDFLHKLQEAKIAYHLRNSRHDAIMVQINVPGERWEVEFLQEGSMEVERFRSDGEIGDETLLNELFARFSDAEETVTHDATASK